MEFDEAFARVVGHEGGYVNRADDPGGETQFGISRRAYPALDIAHLTLADAKANYRRDYWDRCQCDQLPGALRLHVFDAAINSGVRAAAIWLQQAVGAAADGVIGAKTIAAARQADTAAAVARYNGLRLRFMCGLGAWGSFGRGWANRIADNLMEV